MKVTTMLGQADTAPEVSSLDDLADFLDTPEVESEQETEATNPDDSTDLIDTENEEDDGQTDEESSEEPEEKDAAPVEKISFKVKSEDGTEETVELAPDELPAALMRQRDYTKKTQALVEREGQAVEFLKQKHDEIRTQYQTQAEFARSAVAQMAGLRSESEMAQLAQSDPAAWVAEQQRQSGIKSFLSQLDQQINGDRARAQQEQQAHQANNLKQQFDRTWTELKKEKIDKPALEKIYGNVSKTYGFSDAELGNVYDYRLVKMMRDATAYQALKAKKPEVLKQVAEARVPPRQTSTTQEKREKSRNDRFRTGRAKLSDLAAYLNN